MLVKLLGLAAAGACGTLARYGLSGLVQRWSGDSGFPWGTAAVNLLGCLLFGLVWGAAQHRLTGFSSELRVFVLTGFLGAFTTFSTFMFETRGLLADERYLAAGANCLGQNAVGIAAVFAGLALGRML